MSAAGSATVTVAQFPPARRSAAWLPPARLPVAPLQNGADPLSGVRVDPATVAGAVLVLLVAYVVARLSAAGLSALAERAGERRIAVKVFVPLVKFLVYAVAVASILGPIRFGSTELVAAGGLLGAALGFGLKDLFASVVGGLVVVFERPYRVGDKVTLGDHYGEVTDVGLRATRRALAAFDEAGIERPRLGLADE